MARSEISASKSAKRVWPVFLGFWRNCPGHEIFTSKSEEKLLIAFSPETFSADALQPVAAVMDSNNAFREHRIRNVLHLIGQ